MRSKLSTLAVSGLVLTRQALAFAQQHGLPGTTGSDAHAAFEIGHATLRLPDFHDPESLRIAIRQGQRQGGLSPAWVHFASTFAKSYKRLQKRKK